MPTITKTKLNERQITRLELVLKVKREIKSATLTIIEGERATKRIEDDDCNFYYPDDNELDIILNGIKY